MPCQRRKAEPLRFLHIATSSMSLRAASSRHSSAPTWPFAPTMASLTMCHIARRKKRVDDGRRQQSRPRRNDGLALGAEAVDEILPLQKERLVVRGCAGHLRRYASRFLRSCGSAGKGLGHRSEGAAALGVFKGQFNASVLA